MFNSTSKTLVVLDVVHAMNFIHKHGMIYRNLKIENIMLNSLYETKLVDFGLVKISESVIDGFSYITDSLTYGVGFFAYISPEMANYKDYTNKTDVYSFGVILYVLFTGSLPKLSQNDRLNGKQIKLPKPSSSISKFCVKLIEQCLANDPENSPSFELILKSLRNNSYELASGVDPSILFRRDKQLYFIETNNY